MEDSKLVPVASLAGQNEPSVPIGSHKTEWTNRRQEQNNHWPLKGQLCWCRRGRGEVIRVWWADNRGAWERSHSTCVCTLKCTHALMHMCVDLCVFQAESKCLPLAQDHRKELAMRFKGQCNHPGCSWWKMKPDQGVGVVLRHFTKPSAKPWVQRLWRWQLNCQLSCEW